MQDHWLTLRGMQGKPLAEPDLERSQTEWLKACLLRNQATHFGHRHAFDRIDGIRAYRQQVPLHRHEDLAPWIARMAEGEVDILFKGRTVAFEQTGGSSGGSKLIPYSESSLEDIRKAMLPWLGNLIATHGIDSGSLYLSLSPATRQHFSTAGGIPVGLPDAAYLGPLAGSALLALSAVPAWVGGIAYISQWQLATLYWLTRQQALSLISLWSPSFFLQLLKGLELRRSELMELLGHGGSIAGQSLPADRESKTRLQRYLQSHDTRRLWPGLKLVSCWMDGTSAKMAKALRQRLPHASFQGKGLLATEGVTTVPDRNGVPLLALHSGFYEFLQEIGDIRCAWELDEGQTYEVVLTTAGGLYRYRTGDRVRYNGRVDGVPELHFLGRCDLTSDLVGEKLGESFAAQCLEGVSGFGMLAPVQGATPHYTLIVATEVAARMTTAQFDAIECRLKSNPQYAYARKLGQLGTLTLTSHPDPLGVFTAHASMRQRLGDVKVPALLPPTVETERFMEDLT
ncbi:MAG: GH3 auxin-responsive promoter family protein [Candidatus Thiodiazotropha sp. (ex. Lucinisca nassula)]|nr:GH3 auxin-responsive promoter family protein [Candidatus Thiodiazotropha sp. (ex. Lucinisca nassula)]MBW9274627.1 GH3 auxin-responsive promoter family protein [Candidatus Thiodiazotropha sp. (ex. Lucinisca nassula)]